MVFVLGLLMACVALISERSRKNKPNKNVVFGNIEKSTIADMVLRIKRIRNFIADHSFRQSTKRN